MKSEIRIYQLYILHHLFKMFSDPWDRVLWLTTYHPYLQAVPLDMLVGGVYAIKEVAMYLDHARLRGA